MAVTPRVSPSGSDAPRFAASRRPSLLWSRLHFLIRFLGLTGVMAGAAGLLLALFQRELPLPDFSESWHDLYAAVYYAVQDAWAHPQEKWRTLLLLGGLAAVVLALLVEVLAILAYTAGRRSVFGFNAVLQGAFAAMLLVLANVWSFQHPWRLDCTRDQKFTLPPAVRTSLAQLDRDARNRTTVVVYQRHKTFGALTDKPDRYDYAAERKVVEKVKDVAEQLGQVGPQLKVEVLDIEQEGFEDRLRELSKDAPALGKAIEAATENSIFIQSGADLRQMSFNEFYQLDKVASREANDGKGNLVLLAQGGGTSGHGVEAFAGKVLHLQERRPRIGVLVVHELLTTEGSEDVFTLRGLRKTLEAHGFEVRDVVLRKGWDAGMLEPAADTFEESKLDRLEIELDDLNTEVKALNEDVKALDGRVREWSLTPGEKVADKLTALSKKYSRELGGRQLTARGREVLLEYFEGLRTQAKQELDDKTNEKKEKQKEFETLNKDRVIEARRTSDLKAKIHRALEDCDLIFIPRLTRRSNGALIPNRVHRLSDMQVESIKEFVQKGKPVLACFGPTNEIAELGLPPDASGPDNLERLFGELGFRFGKQTVLFNTDSKAFEDRRRNPLRLAEMVAPPPLDFETPAEAARGSWLNRVEPASLPPNPLRESLRVTAHSVGEKFDLRLRFPRPIYFEPAKGEKPKFEPTFLLTANGWNDAQPFAVGGRRPHFEQPKPDDPDNGTIQAKRRGAFPVGVAIETPLPASWTSSGGAARSVRLAAIGQGEVFTGAELSPAKERLFLQTANWLLGRDDYLPRDDHPWSYPRVPLAPESAEYRLWLWGAFGLPFVFAYLGLVVLLIRRLR